MIFLYTLGGNALDTFITLYLHDELGVPESEVTLRLLPYVGTMILFSIPAGFIGQRFGRRRSMLVALVASAVLFIAFYYMQDLATLTAIMPVFGVLWITVIVNALPLVVEMGGRRFTGTLTAYYYIAGSLGAVILAGACALFFVRHGEPEPTREPVESAVRA